MNKENILNLLNNFKGKKIGVVGDLMLDTFVWGDVERISPEAPIPVVAIKEETFTPGGAGNVAVNIAALGGNVILAGFVGNDWAGKQLVHELKKNKINIDGVFKDGNKCTTEKTRVIARRQHILRIDKENIKFITTQQEKKVIDYITPRIKTWEGIIISDYAKGLITEKLVQELIYLARKYKKFVIGDTKSKNVTFYRDATVLTPNQKEAISITGKDDVVKAVRKIKKQLRCAILVTQGAHGMTLFDGSKVKRIHSTAKKVYDEAGAGDTVVAALSLSLASGASLEEAAIIANQTAGIVVGKIGVSSVPLNELLKDFQG